MRCGTIREKDGTMDKIELAKILKGHQLWRQGEGGSRADLTEANLTGADLTGADLTGADLREANLTRADLTEANLTGANLTRADLTRANLTRANLTRANLTEAYLTEADLREANLTRADLTEANLTGANLTGADLTRANLTGAYLTGADLTRANLTRANLTRANLCAPTVFLLCNWGEVSDKLCLELMRYDASNHPHPEKFDEWAGGGSCPYQSGFTRCAYFQEKKELWKKGKAKSARELVIMLFEEKKIKYTEGI